MRAVRVIAVAAIAAVAIAHDRVNISTESNSLSPTMRYFLVAALSLRFVIARTWDPLAEYNIAVIARQTYAGIPRIH